jgi:uncharacterized protein (TIGR03435 family)
MNAKVPPGTSKEQINTMRHNLLIELYRLSYHHDEVPEPKGFLELPVYPPRRL